MPATVSDNLIRKLDELDAQYTALSHQLIDPNILVDHRQVRALSIKKAAIEALVSDYRAYREAHREIDSLRAVIDEGKDDDLIELAREELPGLEERAAELISAIQKRLVTADDQSVGSIILEVRAGVGGDEAGIWAGDVVNMYKKFAALRGWQVEDLQFSPAEHGGFKNAVMSISGEGVWSQLGYEGGTHQVKRVPATEAQGRVHTSTATVAVLAEPEEIEVKIAPEDVREIMTTSQGPGGQNVNKVATACHLIHLPTGLEVKMQETKSQAQNRQKAWQLLRARLYERQRAEAHAQRAAERRTMIGSGDRAEKIRTYRWKENVVVDHRINESFNLRDVMDGRLQPVIDKLVEQDVAQRLATI
ncbi:MAG: PCRF domain-containing protein [Phycisphaerales bacterium]|nr:PCRF domain-containing protein [Phycisphaerales bacterium]